jgi:hypothetical protein
MKTAARITMLLLGLGFASTTFGQSATDDVAAGQRVGQSTKLGTSEAYHTMDSMLADKKWETFKFYVVNQRGKEITLMYSLQGEYVFFTADCDTGCASNMMPPEGIWAYATLERKSKGFWLYTKPAENKHKWTYWNITSLSSLEK